MLAATHAVAGAIIASQTASPQSAYILAFLSHPLLDLFPHWDLSTRGNGGKSKKKIIISSLTDAFIGYAVGFILFGKSINPIVLFLTMFVAQLPDWLEAPYHVFDWDFPPFSTIKKIQHFWHTKLAWPWGAIPQLAIVILAIFLSLK